MEKGQIRRLNKELPEDLIKAQEYFINEAENNTELYLNKYKELISSLNGHYICSDLFKETFSLYTGDIENRKKYSEVIHNSAAVLSNEMFTRCATDESIKKCIFVSGVPGGGKSFLIQSLALAGEIDANTMIFEGDVSSPTIFDKLNLVKENGKELYIIIVNPTLELAQRNAINRHYEIGRGASCETMARIMSKIPNAVAKICEAYPEISLGIYNKKTNYEIDTFTGLEHLEKLNHGTYDEILIKLQELRIKILTEIKEDIEKKTKFSELENNCEGDDENARQR